MDRTRRSGRMAATAGVATISLVLAAGPSAAAGTVDQQQPLGGTCHGVGDMFGQTFTAGLTGQLDQIDMIVLNTGSSAPITVEVRTVSGGFPTDTVLATATIPTEQVPSGLGDVAVPIGPVSVAAGTEYAFVLSRSPMAMLMCGGTTNPYTAGQGVSHSSNAWHADPTLDMKFTTYVSPPPPPPPAPDGAVSGVITSLTNLAPALAPVLNPVRSLLRGLGL